MNPKTNFCLLIALLCSLFSFQVLYANVFSKRVTRTMNHRIMPNQIDSLDIENFFFYSDSEPQLIQNIVSTTTQSTASGPVITTIVSTFENSFSVSEGLTTVHYYEYRDNFQGLYAYYMFQFNENDDLLFTQYTNYSTLDMMFGQFQYRNVHQPDSIYFNASSDDNVYKLFYDEQGRLSYSYWYLNGDLFRGWFLSYDAQPYHYPTPLDFNNYRFYTLTWGGFENSCPIFDKNYAPVSIDYMQWDDWDEYWYEVSTGGYGVAVYSDEVALINTQYGSYSGYFYFNDEGTYTHKHVSYNDGGSVEYTLNWEYGTPNSDDTETPSVSLFSTYPNPFSNSCIIRTDSKSPADVSIYNLKGQLIRSWKGIRTDELTWDGKDSSNHPVSSGMYIIKARQGKSSSTLKVIKY
jgi:hypothetical protein